MFAVGAKVTHTLLPGIFTVAAEPQPNEIGTVLVKVTDAKGERHMMTPERLRPTVITEGGAEFVNSARKTSKRNKADDGAGHQRSDVPSLFE